MLNVWKYRALRGFHLMTLKFTETTCLFRQLCGKKWLGSIFTRVSQERNDNNNRLATPPENLSCRFLSAPYSLILNLCETLTMHFWIFYELTMRMYILRFYRFRFNWKLLFKYRVAVKLSKTSLKLFTVLRQPENKY